MLNILIVEDEILIQKSLQFIFKKKNFNVDVSSSGQEAINKILSKKYDRIICDLMLQDITGFDVIEESKRVLTQKEISETFIIITAYSSSQVLNKAQSYKCPVLNKPFNNLDEILDLIEKK